MFSKIDLVSAYLQLELTENSKLVNTEKGLWQYQRLPFGVSTAPGIFQNVMDQVLNGLEGVCCYLDDILISSPDKVSHMKMLDGVLSRLAQHNIKANRANRGGSISRGATGARAPRQSRQKKKEGEKRKKRRKEKKGSVPMSDGCSMLSFLVVGCSIRASFTCLFKKKFEWCEGNTIPSPARCFARRLAI